jgi:uncharacterized YigZ family protein
MSNEAKRDFPIPAKNGESSLEVKKSRFLGRVYFVTCKDEIKAHLQKLKNEFPDANHHCTAWSFGLNTANEQCDDAGEPSGSAGMPMLQIIRKREIRNILVVVIRWFGGTKLGTGGLARAYGLAAGQAMDDAGLARLSLGVRATLSTDHSRAGKIDYWLRKAGATVENTEYGVGVTWTFTSLKNGDEIKNEVTDLCQGQLEFTIVDQEIWLPVE